MSRPAKLPLLFLLASCLAAAQDLKEFEKRVTEFTLANGLHFIVLEHHQAPVVSFHTYVNAGSVDDPEGKTGLAHMFEHMAFKGTETIGTKNWPEEKKALAAIEEVYDRLEQEQRKGPPADPAKIAAIEEELKAAIEKANSYVIPNQFPTIIEENGGVGMNAGTSLDSTEYFYNLPANRMELWFLLESQRFLHPVFREFYKERDVVMEERRMRVESDPQQKLIQCLLSSAFEAHPYRRLSVGWATDIQSLRVRDAEQFYKTYYVPANITIGIVGDVDPKQARALADKYFTRLPARPLPPLALPLLDAGNTEPNFLKGKWTFLYVESGPCAEACRMRLYQTRQVRLALDRDMPRVQRVFIAGAGCCDAAFLHRQHPDLITVRADAAAAPLLALLPGREANQPGAEPVYLIDPLGNLMMSYSGDVKPKGMLEDMKRLLRLSSIG